MITTTTPARVEGTLDPLVLPMCHHPELIPTQWNQPRPQPCRMVAHCECGENHSCPVCGYGAGSYPCACRRRQNAGQQPRA